MEAAKKSSKRLRVPKLNDSEINATDISLEQMDTDLQEAMKKRKVIFPSCVYHIQLYETWHLIFFIIDAILIF